MNSRSHSDSESESMDSDSEKTLSSWQMLARYYELTPTLRLIIGMYGLRLMFLAGSLSAVVESGGSALAGSMKIV